MKLLHFTFVPLLLGVSLKGFAQSPEASGRKIVYATCIHCHGSDDGTLTGNRISDVPKFLGRIIAPSLTANGIVGKWKEEDFRRFLRTGNRPDKSKKRAYMPLFPNISDDDVRAVFAYLNSVKPLAGSNEQKRSKLSFTARIVSNLLVKNYEDQVMVKHPDTLNRVVWGKYLVNDVLHCFACHSSNPAKINFLIPNLSKGYLQGGFKFKDLEKKKVKAPAIAFANNVSRPYTEEEFLKVLLIGMKRNGEAIRHPMKPYSSLSRHEMQAIYAYLRTIPLQK